MANPNEKDLKVEAKLKICNMSRKLNWEEINSKWIQTKSMWVGGNSTLVCPILGP